MVDGFIIKYLDEELKNHFFEAYQKMVSNEKIWDGNISITSFNIPGKDITIDLLFDDPNSSKIYKGKITLKKQWLYDAEQCEELDKYAKIPHSTKPEVRIKARILYTIFALYKDLKNKKLKIEPGDNTICAKMLSAKGTLFVYSDKQ